MVVSQLAVAANLRAADRTNSLSRIYYLNVDDLHVPVVVLNAALAEFVEALPNVVRVVVHSSANLAEQRLILDLLEKIR